MKRFVLRSLQFLFSFIAILLLIIIPFEFLLRRIPNDYAYKRAYLDKNSDSIEILFLGSSHALHGINPEFVSLRSFNAAYYSQTLDYDLAILKKHKNKWKKLKYIVVPVDYFSLYNNLETGVEKWRVKNYIRYCDIDLDPAHNVFNRFEVLENTPAYNFKRLSNFYYRHISDTKCSALGYRQLNNLKATNLSLDGVTAAKRHLRQSDQFFGHNVNVLNDIIAFGDSNKAVIIFYMSPAYKIYVENLDPFQLNQTIKTVADLASSHNNVHFYNLMSDTAFKSYDFNDADHLNGAGAEKLTRKLDYLIHTLK